MLSEQINIIAEQIDVQNKTIWGLILMMVIFIIKEIFIFFREKSHASHVAKSERKKIIFEQSIKISRELYQELDALSDYSKDQCSLLISNINKIRDKANENRLLMGNRLFKSINNWLDYFVEVSGDFRKKDLAKEKKLMKKFISAFNG